MHRPGRDGAAGSLAESHGAHRSRAAGRSRATTIGASLARPAAWAALLVALALGAPGLASAETMLGVFPGSTFFPDRPGMEILQQLDQWTASAGGARTTFAGMFIGIEDAGTSCLADNPDPYDGSCYSVDEQLELAWTHGYTPLVKMGESSVPRTAREIADGAADAGLVSWAQAFKKWYQRGLSLGEQRFAFLAPLPEANYCDQRQVTAAGAINCIVGSAHYTLDPASFRRAFRHIEDLFAAQGIPRAATRWVFAPNGYTTPGDPGVEEYYPGDALVDAVGFSQYNQGYCYGSPYDYWLDPLTTPPAQELFSQAIAKLRAIAPNRPLFVLQTGSSAQSPAHGVFDDERKNQWLRDAYAFFADEGIAGVMYFNYPQPCDYEMFEPGSRRYDGYRDAARGQGYAYVPPATLRERVLSPPGPCTPTSTALCLRDGRFRVEVRWLDPNARQIESASVVDQTTNESGLFRFWDPENWEIMVKVLDACGANGNGRYWVFASAATDRGYTIVVTDLASGRQREYANPDGRRAAPVLDTDAFASCGATLGASAPSVLGEVAAEPTSRPDPALPAPAATRAEAPAAGSTACVESATAACLQNGRFRAEIDWRGSPGDPLQPALLAPARTPDSAIFTFYGVDNWEVLVKVLDGCLANGNGRFWVYGAAATQREFDLRVTDTATGAVWTRHNPYGVVPVAIADVGAFAGCN